MKMTVSFEVNNADELNAINAFASSLMGTAAPVATTPAAPVATTPAAPVATTPAALAPVEPVTAQHDTSKLDAAGFPHDERIHAKTKTTTQAGYWKKKPRCDKALIEQVEAELKAAYGVTVPPASAAVAATPPPPTPGTDDSVAPPPPPPGTAAAPVPSDPRHKAIVDKITQVAANPNATRTVGALEHYGVDESLTGPQALAAFIGAFGAENINDIASIEANWDSLIAGLEYTWPTS